jgi:hypothetical protein
MLSKQSNRLVSLTIIMILCLAFWSPRPVQAMSTGDTLELTVLPIGIVLGTAAAGYMYYKYRYSQPADAKGRLGYKGPGEFFVGGFLGAAFVPNTNWTYQAGGLSTTADSMKIDSGITGGVKVGYFFDSIPVFGIEGEGSIGSHRQPSQTFGLNPPFLGATTGQVSGQSMLAWTMAFHFLGRYGFFPTTEIPFGRLQPYVGIGPGLVVLYAEADSAKNFSLEFEAGLRYMFTKNLGGFLEYKLSQQWQVELDSQTLLFNNTGITTNKVTFDFTRNQIVLGLSYHF